MRLFSPVLLAQIRKEFLSILRDPRTRALLIGPPLLQLLIFSFAATLEVKNTAIAVYDRDGGQWSQELVGALANASFVGSLTTVTHPKQLQSALEKRQILLAITIPENFSRDLARGQQAHVQVIVDGRRANSGQIALGYVEAVVGNLNTDIRPTLRATGDTTALRQWFNTNLIYQWFVVPSLSGILAMFSSLIVTALSIARERELGTFDQLLVSPATPLEIIVAKALPALVIGTTLGMVMVTAGILIFQIPFYGSLLWLFLVMVLFILSTVGVGLMISSLCNTQQQAILGAFSVGVPVIIMSGFATPVENMPVALQWVAEMLPLKHYLLIAQGSFLKGLDFWEVMGMTWPIGVAAVVTLGAAVVLVRGRLE